MLQPHELTLHLPVVLSGGVRSTTDKVWSILKASYEGELEKVQSLVGECPELIYAQYNYTPPIHFAVREGHIQLVKFLLRNGAYDPSYKIYPFNESLITIAHDRGETEIVQLLEEYHQTPSLWKFTGDNGEILYNRTQEELDFQKSVDNQDFEKTSQLLNNNPNLTDDPTFFWGEGIMMMPAKVGNKRLVQLLLTHGATFPKILKWAQFYYFERDDMAAFLLEKGMDPNVQSWHQVTLLHDMAQKGNLLRAKLLVEYGANLNAIDDEYRSTPLGLAARWGHLEMSRYLLDQGADPGKAGADWSRPLAWAEKKQHFQILQLLLDAGARL